VSPVPARELPESEVLRGVRYLAGSDLLELVSPTAKFCPECARPVDSTRQICRRRGGCSTMFREMDMRFWLEQAEAEMKELS